MRSLIRVSIVSCRMQSLEADKSDDDGGADDDTADETKDNRNIAQDGLAQQLNEQELLQLKADLPGSEYVRRVAANNAAFSLKTKFAKEKYLARKQKKYVRLVALRYASLH